ncbi:MAG: hypothetical protein AAF662_01590 [Pseudomonadota bacterium]
MVFLSVEVEPAPGRIETLEYGGAFVSVWVRVSDVDHALRIAESALSGWGWRTVTVEEKRLVKREDFAEPESIESFDQAFQDGEAYFFDAYPAGSN